MNPEVLTFLKFLRDENDALARPRTAPTPAARKGIPRPPTQQAAFLTRADTWRRARGEALRRNPSFARNEDVTPDPLLEASIVEQFPDREAARLQVMAGQQHDKALAGTYGMAPELVAERVRAQQRATDTALEGFRETLQANGFPQAEIDAILTAILSERR